MIERIIALALLGIGIILCTLWSANTAIKWQRVVTEIFSCVGVFALCTIIALGATLPERDTAEAAKFNADLKLVEDADNLSDATDKLGGDNISVQIADTDAASAELELTPEQLIKLFIDKWDGVLPVSITLTFDSIEP